MASRSDTGLSLSGEQYQERDRSAPSPLAGQQYQPPLKLRQELGGGPVDLSPDERAAKIKSFGGKTP